MSRKAPPLRKMPSTRGEKKFRPCPALNAKSCSYYSGSPEQTKTVSYLQQHKIYMIVLSILSYRNHIIRILKTLKYSIRVVH